ncbi:MAG: DUF4920 domain-containing protein [Acidobacteria bacterium]|nr:DUF4920 domain-containing protein [Acidobacteriota bacterium]
MKRILLSMTAVLLFAGITMAQGEMNSKGEPVHKGKDNAPVELSKGESITRGEALAKGIKKAKVEKAMQDPAKLTDEIVELNGVVVRSCKKEGCWAEIADKDGGKSVRVTFGDHAFFIPLNAAGMKVKAQGKFVTKVLPKEHVDHLINDDGAKFDNRNADGTVTEVSFDATGVVLTKAE